MVRAAHQVRAQRMSLPTAGPSVLVGVASTPAFVVLYLLVRQAMSAQAANAVSLLVTATPRLLESIVSRPPLKPPIASVTPPPINVIPATAVAGTRP
jgi:hypothetical protein